RRSKKNQTERADTIDSQLDELRKFARDHGWNNILELTERGAPASAAADRVQRRKVFHGELKPMVGRGEVDRVLVVDPSRISRDMVVFLSFVRDVETFFTRMGGRSSTQ